MTNAQSRECPTSPSGYHQWADVTEFKDPHRRQLCAYCLMGKSRVLVAIMDGIPDRTNEAFAPGSVSAARGIPVTRNFDPRLPPMGLADLIIESTNVYAEIDLMPEMKGLYPALGGRAITVTLVDSIRRIDELTALELSLCVAENADPRIGRI
jgi:hypothetical protein